jgi:hypothetical protein
VLDIHVFKEAIVSFSTIHFRQGKFGSGGTLDPIYKIRQYCHDNKLGDLEGYKPEDEEPDPISKSRFISKYSNIHGLNDTNLDALEPKIVAWSDHPVKSEQYEFLKGIKDAQEEAAHLHLLPLLNFELGLPPFPL